MDKKLNDLLNELNKGSGILLMDDGNLVRKLGKLPKIRELRKNNRFYIGHDRKMKTTIIYKK